MFAGPNGSGKSTIYGLIPPALRGVYVNPDDIERAIRTRGDMLDLGAYGVRTTRDEVLGFFQSSRLLAGAGLLGRESALHFDDGRLDFSAVELNAYFASVAADFIRRKLLDARADFTFETVMSSPDKVTLLAAARARGYRTYLYYVATEDPAINVSRVRQRVRAGGHAVPEDKIVSRYHRSLGLLFDAVRETNRAYLFDNSGPERLWVAEVTDGRRIDPRTSEAPDWFRRALWDKFLGTSSDGNI